MTALLSHLVRLGLRSCSCYHFMVQIPNTDPTTTESKRNRRSMVRMSTFRHDRAGHEEVSAIRLARCRVELDDRAGDRGVDGYLECLCFTQQGGREVPPHLTLWLVKVGFVAVNHNKSNIKLNQQKVIGTMRYCGYSQAIGQNGPYTHNRSSRIITHHKQTSNSCCLWTNHG